jgi:dTDP-glucose 4,6-dehydratase
LKILITGAAGFVGHHVLNFLLKQTKDNFVLLDRLDHSGTLHRLEELKALHKDWNERVRFVFHDLKAPINDHVASKLEGVEQVYHLAAASHVDRSIADPMSFVQDNVVGTVNLLEWARSCKTLKKFLYFSTDEVFGPAPPGKKYAEWDRYRSTNPYAASKAAAEEMCLAYQNTYGVPVVITHTMNVIGERQSPEKFVPSTIRKILAGETVTIHANKERTQAGTRHYIHASDVASATHFVMRNGIAGEKYNIVGEREIDNLTLAKMIAEFMNMELKFEMVDFHSSRPGHDLRYALDGERLATMGWKHSRPIEQHLKHTVHWTLNNLEWLA